MGLINIKNKLEKNIYVRSRVCIVDSNRIYEYNTNTNTNWPEGPNIVIKKANLLIICVPIYIVVERYNYPLPEVIWPQKCIF